MKTGEKIIPSQCHHNRLRARFVSTYVYMQIIESFPEGSVFQHIRSQLLLVDQATVFMNSARTIGLF